jgi:hypothetical protein
MNSVLSKICLVKSLFFPQDVIMLGLMSFGFLCGGVATTLLANGSWKDLPTFYQTASAMSSDSNVSEVYMEIAKKVTLSTVFATCVVVSVSLYNTGMCTCTCMLE